MKKAVDKKDYNKKSRGSLFNAHCVLQNERTFIPGEDNSGRGWKIWVTDDSQLHQVQMCIYAVSSTSLTDTQTHTRTRNERERKRKRGREKERDRERELHWQKRVQRLFSYFFKHLLLLAHSCNNGRKSAFSFAHLLLPTPTLVVARHKSAICLSLAFVLSLCTLSHLTHSQS